MKLEWFRRHKQFVYYILLPVVGIGMAFFGASSALQSVRSARHGPGIEYKAKAGDRWHYMGPSEVMALRYALTQYMSRQVSSKEAAMHEVAWHVAAEAGFELGQDETRDDLCEQIKQRTEQPAASDKLYKKLLTSLQLTSAQFEDLTREMHVWQKLAGYLSDECKADDQELLVAYTEEKEVVRLRFKELKTEELLAKGKEQPKEQIKKCYDEFMRLWELEQKNQERQSDDFKAALAKEKEDFRRTYKVSTSDLTDALIAKSKLSADMVFLDIDKLTAGDLKPEESELKPFYEKEKSQWKIQPKAGEAAPTPGNEKYKPFEEVRAEVETKWKEKELKDYYDRNKVKNWMKMPKPGDPPPKPGEGFKPFDEVKAEVEKKWEQEQRVTRASRRLSKLKDEEAEAEKAYAKEQEGKPEAERKPFDVAEWAKKLDLVYWSTDELTEAQYKAGKKEVKAADAAWGKGLFSLMHDFTANMRITSMEQARGIEAYRRSLKENRKKFHYPEITEPLAKEQGAVMAKIKKYVPEEAKPFDAVSDAIAKQLRMGEGAELIRAEWAEGKVPPVDSLDEVRGNKQDSKNALVREFFESPKAVGEVLDVAKELVDPEKPEAGQRFYVGFAVDRELPTWDSFNHDTVWKREDKRKELERSHVTSRIEALRRQMEDMGHRLGAMKDPPVFDEYRRGGPVPDDDY